MNEIVLKYINPIKILVLLSFWYAIRNLKLQNINSRFLMGILTVCVVTEIMGSVFLWYQIPNMLFMTCSIIVHDVLWLSLLRQHITCKWMVSFGILFFGVVILIDFALSGASLSFKYYSFVAGALVYIVIFLYENYLRIKREDISFFVQNEYLLLAAPILFFIDLSLMFGFDSYELTSATVFKVFKLYDFVIYFVNISYYLLINIYTYRQKKYL